VFRDLVFKLMYFRTYIHTSLASQISAISRCVDRYNMLNRDSSYAQYRLHSLSTYTQNFSRKLNQNIACCGTNRKIDGSKRFYSSTAAVQVQFKLKTQSQIYSHSTARVYSVRHGIEAGKQRDRRQKDAWRCCVELIVNYASRETQPLSDLHELVNQVQ
jgi:hypothetical protein